MIYLVHDSVLFSDTQKMLCNFTIGYFPMLKSKSGRCASYVKRYLCQMLRMPLMNFLVDLKKLRKQRRNLPLI